MILIDYSALMHQSIFSSIKQTNPRLKDGYYITKDFITNTKYTILERLFELQTKYEHKYGNIVICLDNTFVKNWRKDIYYGYKASRKKGREKSQINYAEVFSELNALIEELKTNSPWKVVDVFSAEADDVVLCLSKAFALYEKILIVSSDKDMIQAQRYGDVSQYSLLTLKFITPETKHENSVQDWITEHIVLGDGADDIPKVTDETEFSPEFLKFMKENNLNYSEMDFDCMDYSDIESITAKFDVWKTDKSGNKIEKKIYKNPRFGPSTLKKKIEEYGSLDNWLCSNPLYFKHYERNKKLILAEEIPTDIYNMCLLNYKAAKTSFNAKDFKQYLLDNDMGKLIAELPANFSKQSLEDFFG